MKILIDARLYGLEHAGLGRYTINLIDGLQKIDTENQYVVLLRKKYFTQLNLPKNWKKVLVDFKHYSLAEQIKLPRIIAKENPNLVHFLNFNIPVFYKGKFIVTIHDLLMSKHRNAKGTTLPFYLFYPKHIAAKYAIKKAIKTADKIIVPSKAVKDEIIDYYKINPQKIVITYEGVDEKLKSTGDSEAILTKYRLTEPYFIYAGNAYPHKNLERAISALSSLNKKQGSKILFAIASSRNVFTQKLEETIKRSEAQKYVKLLGFVPDSHLGHLFKESAAFLYPSLSEGFGLPGLEAMASGTIALVSDIPVFKEIYKDKAIYFDPYRIESMADAMTKVIDMDTNERQKTIEEGKEFVKQYSWSKMAKETLKVYESCASLR